MCAGFGLVCRAGVNPSWVCNPDRMYFIFIIVLLRVEMLTECVVVGGAEVISQKTVDAINEIIDRLFSTPEYYGICGTEKRGYEVGLAIIKKMDP